MTKEQTPTPAESGENQNLTKIRLLHALPATMDELAENPEYYGKVESSLEKFELAKTVSRLSNGRYQLTRRGEKTIEKWGYDCPVITITNIRGKTWLVEWELKDDSNGIKDENLAVCLLAAAEYLGYKYNTLRDPRLAGLTDTLIEVLEKNWERNKK